MEEVENKDNKDKTGPQGQLREPSYVPAHQQLRCRLTPETGTHPKNPIQTTACPFLVSDEGIGFIPC